MESVVPFSVSPAPAASQVGGKGLSLILLTRQGFPVPPGLVLTVEFFSPWFSFVEGSAEWREVKGMLQAPGAGPVHGAQLDLQGLKEATERLKGRCRELSLNAGQRALLREHVGRLERGGAPPLMAVRSSAPEEDLETASFAGGYTTVLGVSQTALEPAIGAVFASCLDHRVFLYKREHGFPVAKPRIAVIVQKLIAADCAGVAFSINPIDNCYDEVAVSAAFGLGESVVAGRVTPDTLILDKHSQAVLASTVGSKDTVIRIEPSGATVERPCDTPRSPSITAAQGKEIARTAKQVEARFGRPVDIEWAYEGGGFYLLQARPVTAYLRIPREMVTEPGQPKRLYMNFTLVAQGIARLLSILGLEFFERMQIAFMRSLLGIDVVGLAEGLFGNLAGRSFLNVSNMLRLPGGKSLFARIARDDPIAVATVGALDGKEYVAPRRPRRLRWFLLKAALNTTGYRRQARRAYADPDSYRREFLREEKARLAEIESLEGDASIAPGELAGRLSDWYARFVSLGSLPVTGASQGMALPAMRKLFGRADLQTREKLTLLERALPNNVTIEMGLALYRLSQHVEVRRCADTGEFQRRLRAGDFSPEFTRALEAFLRDHGFRVPMELDLATPRPNEDPGMLFDRLQSMAQNTDRENNPEAVFHRARRQREEARAELAGRLSERKAASFQKNYHVWVTLGGYREIHKYYLIRITDLLRKRTLRAADLLVRRGQLQEERQVFDVSLAEIDRALADPAVELQREAERNLRRLREEAFQAFPALFDSRGRIVTPPPQEPSPGEIRGQPISPGTARGRVRVLHEPDEKAVLPGDILVARATDPGWTPLFINAAGIVLEIGGMMQHGAVVAREYGKPCIAGIERATEVLAEGQLVEMDGGTGLVRILDG